MKPMETMKPMQPMEPIQQECWWPEALGMQPNSAGGQNEVRYAYFADKNRLAVDSGGGNVHIYDTKGHQVSGVQQDQSDGTGKLVFTDGEKKIGLDTLQKVSA